MKLARKVTGRANIASFTNGFHGMSLGALSATGSTVERRGAGIPLGLVDRYPFDGYFGTDIDTIEWIAKLLDDPSSRFDPAAAFLVETVHGEGGVNTATDDWLERLAALAERYKSLPQVSSALPSDMAKEATPSRPAPGARLGRRRETAAAIAQTALASSAGDRRPTAHPFWL